MLKQLKVCLLALVLAGCAALGGSPEAQIKNGATVHTAATNAAANLLQRDRITGKQAKTYRTLLGTASQALDDSYKQLVACRVKSGSTQDTVPDPCKASVGADIGLALSVLTELEKTLKAKE